MPDITLSPIPYGGGTLSTSYNTSYAIPMNDTLTRWVYAFRQNNPNYTILGIADISPSVDDPSPTVTYVKQRAFDPVYDYVRLFKVSSTSFLLVHFTYTSPYYTATLELYDISTNDFVKINTWLNAFRIRDFQAGMAVVGLSSNTFLVAYREYITSYFYLQSKTFTTSSITTNFTHTVSDNNSSYRKINVKWVDMDKLLFYDGDYSLFTPRIVASYDITNDTFGYTIFNTNPLPPVVISPTKVLFLVDSDTWYEYDPTTNNYVTVNKTITYKTFLSYQYAVEMGNNNFVGLHTGNDNYQLFYYDAANQKIGVSFNTKDTLGQLPPSFYIERIKESYGNSVFVTSNTSLRAVKRTSSFNWTITDLNFE